ncbi:MAG: STAS domain-containing protein [Candidatus Rifleibacteriota bacterium]
MKNLIEQREFGEHIVFFLKGYMNKEMALRLLSQYRLQKEKGMKFFILDFSEVTLVNSSALSCLLDIVSECIGEEDTGFYFCGVQENCYYGMSAVGLMNCVTEYDSFEQAKADLLV